MHSAEAPMQLPYEVLGLVFTYLPQRDLDTVQLVCKSWKDIASDKIWREQFRGYFGTTEVCPVSPYFTRWRRELIVRTEVLQKWKRCSKVTDFTINSTLTDNTHVFCNFATDLPRATCFNAHKGSGNIIELDKGKIKRKLYASRHPREVLPVATADGSRFGLINAFLDGSATTIIFSREGTIAMEHKDLPYKHDTLISAVWIAKSRNFSKQTSRSTGIATGSFDGTVFLNNAHGYHRFQPERSPVLMLEGSMYGSYAANDGDSVVALYGNGTLYRFQSTQPEAGATKVAQLPLTRTTMGPNYQLHMCNDYAIVQTASGIHIVDLNTGAVSALELPPHAEITAFSIDKSYTPGTKYMVAGLSTNELCAWSLPAIEFVDSNYEGPKVTIVGGGATKTTPPPEEQPSSRGESPLPDSLEARVVDTKPVWRRYSPIGYDRQLEQSEKPQLTKIALNAAVVLIAGYNGVVMALDVLSGRPLKRVNSRISKNVLDLNRYSRDGLVPVTQLEIDPNPLRLRGLIAVRPAIQYFDLGSVGLQKHQGPGTKKGSRPKRSNPTSKTVRYDMEEEIQLHDEYEIIDAAQNEHNATLAEDFAMEGMGEEEQLAYAMMLSEQNEQNMREMVAQEGAEDDMDEDLRLALQLSSVGEPENRESRDNEESQDVVNADDLSDDEDLRRAIALSLHSS